ncbi:MAG: ABC transporter ATP-binding protein [Sarcina sp.]
MECAVKVKNLNKSYDDFSIKNINFNIEKGTIMGFIGKNGAGKTTTIKTILNVIEKNSGYVELFGKEFIANEISIKEDIAVVFSEGGFFEKLTIKKARLIMKSIYKNWSDNIFYKYLEKLNLEENKKINKLSTGMKKKLNIVLAMSHNPKLLILDEPTAGLDPIAREEFLDLFLEFMEDESHSIIISSHITTDLEKIADNITFIDEGEIIFSKNKDNIIYFMGIAKCTEEDFQKIKCDDYLFYRKNVYSYELLIENKIVFNEKYKNIIVDNATIDEIMMFYIKGKK